MKTPFRLMIPLAVCGLLAACEKTEEYQEAPGIHHPPPDTRNPPAHPPTPAERPPEYP